MIKCEVSVVGTVKDSPTRRTSKDGTKYFAFPMKVRLKSNEASNPEREVNVYCYENLDTKNIKVGARIEAVGVLSVRKRTGVHYISLNAKEFKYKDVDTIDDITGKMTFYGTIGREIIQKEDKHNDPYIIFSGFSTEKVDDTYEYTWVRFIGFGMQKEDWMEKKTRIEAIGTLEASIYNDQLDLSCRLEELKKSEYKPQQQPATSAGVSAKPSATLGTESEEDAPF